MDKLVRYLNLEFNNRNEKCILIIEPKVPYTVEDNTFYKTPDAIVIKDNVICIIDLKGYYGEIIADCHQGESWKNTQGEIIQVSGSENPYIQAKKYHELFLEHLNKNILSKNTSKSWSISNVYSWIVTGELSKVEPLGIDMRKNRFFNILPLEQVAKKIAFLGSNYKLTAKNIEKITASLGAIRVPIEEWYRSGRIQTENPSGLIPKITQLMDSSNGEDQLKGLNYVQELELKQHRIHILQCIDKSPYVKIRREALLILIKWQDWELGNILDKTLKDTAQELVFFTLDYLIKDGYPETFHTLSDMLVNSPPSMTLRILKAITSTGHPNSCKILYDFTKKTFFDRPFRLYSDARQRYLLTKGKKTTRESYKLYHEAVQGEHHLIDLTALILDCLGESQCSESVSWIIDVIMKPTSIGFHTNDYTELEKYTNYHRIFSSACNALYNIEPDAINISSFLLEKLPISPEYYQYYIIKLLGMYKENKAVQLLKLFLKNCDDQPEEVAINALENIGTNEAFEVLQKEYFSNPLSYSGVLISQALRSMNEDFFIDLILEQLNSDDVHSELKIIYLQAIRGSTSLKCTNTLFNLLSNEDLSNLAAWNLTFLMDNFDLFQRAMTLTSSKDPIEQSGAIWALEKYFIANPSELERFESENTHVNVRRALVSFYSDSNSKNKLFSYSKDPDEEIRDIVFSYFTDRKFLGYYIVSGNKIQNKSSMVAIEENLLCIKLINELLLIPKENIRKSIVSTYKDDYYGVYLEFEIENSTISNMLLIPVRNYYGTSDYHITVISDMSDSNPLTKKELYQIDILWKKIEKFLFSKS